MSLSTGAVWAGRVQNHPPLCRKKARRYGAVIGLSAGLIGPDGTSRTYSRSLQDTPVFLGCSDVDPHIPLARVHESCAVWQAARSSGTLSCCFTALRSLVSTTFAPNPAFWRLQAADAICRETAGPQSTRSDEDDWAPLIPAVIFLMMVAALIVYGSAKFF